jgi:hypothetical protein
MILWTNMKLIKIYDDGQCSHDITQKCTIPTPNDP